MDWRLFIQSLAAFHKLADAEALACLEKIPPESILRKTADMLAAASRGERSAVTDLMSVQTPAGAFKRKLQVVQGLTAQRLHRDAVSRLKEIKDDPFLSKTPGLFVELCARTLPNTEEAAKLLGKLNIDGQTFVRVNAMFMNRTTQDILDDWESLLALKLTKAERALALARVGELSINKALENDEDDFSDDFGTIFNKIRRSFGYGSDDSDCHDNSSKNGDEVDLRALKTARSNFAESARLMPTAWLFQKWLDAENQLPHKVKDTQAVLRAWSEAMPEDMTPLLRLLEDYRRLCDYEKAVVVFERLDKLAAGNPAVEAVRGYIHLDHALSLGGSGQVGKCVATLDEICASGSPYLKALSFSVKLVIYISANKPSYENAKNKPSNVSLLKKAMSPFKWLAAAKDKLSSALSGSLVGMSEVERNLAALRQPLTAIMVGIKLLERDLTDDLPQECRGATG